MMNSTGISQKVRTNCVRAHHRKVFSRLVQHGLKFPKKSLTKRILILEFGVRIDCLLMHSVESGDGTPYGALTVEMGG